MDVPDTNERGLSGPWVFVPGSFSATDLLTGFLSAQGAKAVTVRVHASAMEPCLAAHAAGILAPCPGGPLDTRIVLYFAPGCYVHQIPGDEGNRARIGLMKQLIMRFLDAADIGCKLDREMLERGVEGEVSTTEAAFTLSGMLLDEILAMRLGHLLLRMLSVNPISVEDDGGNEYPVRFCGAGFMHL